MANQTNTQKDPDDWVTGDEPITGAQKSYLGTLAAEAGEPVDEDLTKAEASTRIDELQAQTGRATCAVRPSGLERRARRPHGAGAAARFAGRRGVRPDGGGS